MKKGYFMTAAVLLGSLVIMNPLTARAAMSDGWRLEDSTWYYYQDDKKTADSWVWDQDDWYYLGSDGAMVTGWLEWRGQWYYLNQPNGEMAAATVTPDGYRVDRSGAWIKEKYDNLKQNEYQELSMAVSLSGSQVAGETVTLTITVKNEGKQTLVYTRGSGSFVTPQALMVRVSGLQPVLPKDYLGPATMDYRRDTLEPGQEVSYTMKVRLIQPSEQFDTYSYQMRDEYIGDVSWAGLKAAYPDLNAAAAGTYTGQVYFLYSLMQTDGSRDIFGEDTGYIAADFNIEVRD